jgi:hypothetical protein
VIYTPAVGETFIRKSLNKNWGLFRWGQIKTPYLRNPKCECPHCQGHPTWDTFLIGVWQPIYMAMGGTQEQLLEVVLQAQQFGLSAIAGPDDTGMYRVFSMPK